MKYLVFTVSMLACISFTHAQNLHTPAEIFKIIEESELTYELGILEEPIPVPDRSNRLNYNHYYRTNTDGKLATYSYELSDETKELLDLAEKQYAQNDYTLARSLYLQVLESDSSYYEVMTYIGQMYEAENDYEKAIEWYQTTIEHNYIDYMAHWFLADAYYRLERKEEALNEISIALVLNRNNPRLRSSFDRIYKQNKLSTSNWTFNPQIKLDSISATEYSLQFDEDWLGFGLVKAVWAFEPGYSESMGVAKGQYSTIEEKEAIASLLSGLSKKQLKKVPEFKALKMALDQGMINDYILFETVLTENPHVAYQLPEETILSIQQYLITVRGSVK